MGEQIHDRFDLELQVTNPKARGYQDHEYIWVSSAILIIPLTSVPAEKGGGETSLTIVIHASD